MAYRPEPRQQDHVKWSWTKPRRQWVQGRYASHLRLHHTHMHVMYAGSYENVDCTCIVDNRRLASKISLSASVCPVGSGRYRVEDDWSILCRYEMHPMCWIFTNKWMCNRLSPVEDSRLCFVGFDNAFGCFVRCYHFILVTGYICMHLFCTFDAPVGDRKIQGGWTVRPCLPIAAVQTATHIRCCDVAWSWFSPDMHFKNGIVPARWNSMSQSRQVLSFQIFHGHG